MGTPSYKNRIGMTVTGTPGTGTITLGSAETGYQSFSTAYGANANVDILIEDGSNWEIARDCTYTHSGTTVSRGTLEASSTGSVLSLTSAAKVYVIQTAERYRRAEQGYLEHSSHDGSAAVTGVVGTMHVFTGLTADRDFTLPATAATGDRIGVSFPAGSASYEILLKSASGDKINNADCSTTEWSRLFIAGEMVIFRCIDGATVDWVVEQDGRIPQQCDMEITTSPDGETAATFTRPTAAASAGAWTARVDNASLATVATDRITVRRACNVKCNITARIKDTNTDGKYISAALYKNVAETLVLLAQTAAAAAESTLTANSRLIPLAAGDYLVFKYRTEVGGLGLQTGQAWFGLCEVL